MSWREWIKKGEDDLKLAKLALDNDIPDYAAFNAQQAVEKFLKAFLIKNDKPLIRTHGVAYLIERCKETNPSFEELYELGAHYLSDFAVEVRYPCYHSVPTEIAEEAIKIADKVTRFILTKLGERA